MLINVCLFFISAPPPNNFFVPDRSLIDDTDLGESSVMALFEDFLFLKEQDIMFHVLQALGSVAIVFLIVGMGLEFTLGWSFIPGHKDGGLYPFYIPEHYGRRNSQYPFDPYRLVTKIQYEISLLRRYNIINPGSIKNLCFSFYF